MCIEFKTDSKIACAVCHVEKGLNRCARCREIFYCSVECQKSDWKQHKRLCTQIRSDHSEETKKSDKMWVSREIARLKLKNPGRFKEIQALYGVRGKTDFDGLQILQESGERTLMTLAFCAFEKPAYQYRYFDGIPGIKIIEEWRYGAEDFGCEEFAFQSADWYRGPGMHMLFVKFPEIIPFFKERGYEVVATPEAGDIVVYFSYVHRLDVALFQLRRRPSPQPKELPEVSHYGKVHEVREDGTVIVRSKFGPASVYEHRLELVPYMYGDTYVFLHRKKGRM